MYIILTGASCTKLLKGRCKVVRGGFTIYRNKNETETATSDEELEQDLKSLIQNEMKMGHISSSINGIDSLYYLGDSSASGAFGITGTSSESQLKKSSDLPLYGSILIVITTLVGMAGIGSAIKRKQDNRNIEEHQPLENGLSFPVIQSNEDDGWESMIRSSNNAVEVCLENR